MSLPLAHGILGYRAGHAVHTPRWRAMDRLTQIHAETGRWYRLRYTDGDRAYLLHQEGHEQAPIWEAER